MELIPSTFGIVLTAFVLWHVLKTEKAVEEMADRPGDQKLDDEPCDTGPLRANPGPRRD